MGACTEQFVRRAVAPGHAYCAKVIVHHERRIDVDEIDLAAIPIIASFRIALVQHPPVAPLPQYRADMVGGGCAPLLPAEPDRAGEMPIT